MEVVSAMVAHLIDIIDIFNLKCRIPLRTLIFIPYDSQGISIIDPITGSYLGQSYIAELIDPF